MARQKRIKHICIIDARRWFDRPNGNTYHSATVTVDGETIGRVPFAYGYDESYLQTAHEILQRAGYFPADTDNTPRGKDSYNQFLGDMRGDNRKKYHVTCCDVSRKKDL